MDSDLQKVETEVDGKIYRGMYRTHRVGKTQWVTVTCQFGEKGTHIGGSPPELLARIMLGELVRNPQYK